MGILQSHPVLSRTVKSSCLVLGTSLLFRVTVCGVGGVGGGGDCDVIDQG